MSADLLRQAAAKLQEHAEKASAGAWTEPERDGNSGDEGWWIFNGRLGTSEYAVAVTPLYSPKAEADARYIALMHPPVALALADLLDMTLHYTGLPNWQHDPRCGKALHLAREVLREPS